MPSLSEVLNAVAADGDAWRLESAEGWTQGRTLYGGMTAAICAHVATAACADLPPLRSAQVAFIGPAAGPLTLQAAELRRGRSATIVGVDCSGDGGLAARAIFTYGDARESKVSHERSVPAPAVNGPDDYPPFHPPERQGVGFFQQFDIRSVAGSRPMQGEPPEFLAWVRLKQPAGAAPVPALLALADSLPPAAMAVFPAPAPISTMTWQIDFAHQAPPPGWLLLSSSSEQADDGYSLQAMSLWDETGRRIAIARQMVAIFA